MRGENPTWESLGQLTHMVLIAVGFLGAATGLFFGASQYTGAIRAGFILGGLGFLYGAYVSFGVLWISRRSAKRN
jgi:hypothetical protein